MPVSRDPKTGQLRGTAPDGYRYRTRRGWWDYERCDRRSEGNRRLIPLSVAARDLVRRQVSPQKWVIEDCPVRVRPHLKTGERQHSPCIEPVVRRYAQDEDYTNEAAYQRYQQRHRWHEGFQGYLCHHCHPWYAPERADQLWALEAQLRQEEAEAEAVLTALRLASYVCGLDEADDDSA